MEITLVDPGLIEPPCPATLGLMSCLLAAGHSEAMHLAMAHTSEGLSEVQWADGCPAYRDNGWMNSLVEDKDDPMPAVYAIDTPEDGKLHLDWFRN